MIFLSVDDGNNDESGLLFLSASQDQNIHMWRVSTTNSAHKDDDNDVVSDKSAESATLLHQFKGHARSVDAIAVSPNQQEVCLHACER